jgi:hypothetical protein
VRLCPEGCPGPGPRGKRILRGRQVACVSPTATFSFRYKAPPHGRMVYCQISFIRVRE